VIDRSSSETFFCQDLAFRDAPSASTAENALAALLDTRGGDVADWKSIDHSTDRPEARGEAPYEHYVYAPARSVSHPRLASISVQGRNQTWSAIGGCVAEREIS
jgi:hypothetical protein